MSTAIDDAATGRRSAAQPLGEPVYDTATVTGTPFTPTGTVTYYFYDTATPDVRHHDAGQHARR